MKVTKVRRNGSYPMGITKCMRVRRTDRIHSWGSDSCHSRCIGINKIYILNPTVVVKLLQYSDSRVEHRDRFSSYKLIYSESKW